MNGVDPSDPCVIDPYAYPDICAQPAPDSKNGAGLTTAQTAALGGVALFAFLFLLLLVFAVYTCQRAKREDTESGVEAVGRWKEGGGEVEVKRIPQLASRAAQVRPVPPTSAIHAVPAAVNQSAKGGASRGGRAEAGRYTAPSRALRHSATTRPLESGRERGRSPLRREVTPVHQSKSGDTERSRSVPPGKGTNSTREGGQKGKRATPKSRSGEEARPKAKTRPKR